MSASDPEDLHLASVDEALSTTRSVRKRLDFERPIEPEVLEECIDVAVQAPTGAQQQGWRFVVVTDAEKKEALARLYRQALAGYRARLEAEGAEVPQIKPSQQALADRMHEFPALVVVCIVGRPEPESVARQVAFYGSVLPAAWSLMVALRARGIGSTWTTLHLLHEEAAAAALGIPTDVTQTVLLPVGYMKGAVLRRADRQGAQEVTYWNAWGERRGGRGSE